jgi:hypothetical protein
MRKHATGRGWTIAAQTQKIGPRASERDQREKLLAVARRRDGDFPERRLTPPRSKTFANLSNHLAAAQYWTTGEFREFDKRCPFRLPE